MILSCLRRVKNLCYFYKYDGNNSLEKSRGTQIFNGSGIIMAKNQELVSAVSSEFFYLVQQAKAASENMSEAQKQEKTF